MQMFPPTTDTLPELSKGVDSSSTSASCVGSNPTGVTWLYVSRKPCHIQICVCGICAAFHMSTYRQRAVCQRWLLFKHDVAIALLSISKHKQTSVLLKCGHRISSELPPTELGWQVDSLLLVANAFLETTSPPCSASLGVVVANS